jgi:ATP-dependent helicase/nuclease subunit A
MLARHAGTVIHKLLEEIARKGPESWQEQQKGDLKVRIERSLGRLGTPAAEIARGAEKVLRALETCLLGERGLWILGKRKEAGCEFEISGIVDGQLIHAVVDRTFVDEDGTRWIIDYKSSEGQGRTRDAFLKGEMERYRSQVTAYARLFRQMEPERPLRAGLYFPLLDDWREVSLDELWYNEK